MASDSDPRRWWITGHPVLAYAPGRKKDPDAEDTADTVVLIDDDGEEHEQDGKTLEELDLACLNGVDELLQLGIFNEASLLHNVRVRYAEEKIYTGIGSPILISVNPYKNIVGLYSEETRQMYRRAGAAQASGQDSSLPPHLYSVADSAYRTVLNERSNQSIIISGESGAGKTEATKRILEYLSEMSSGAAVSGERTVEQQVLDSNPVLEAFGNAKTVRNDNSSRFGKFVEVEFDGGGRLVSAKIQNYLLEKCRIVTQQPDERNYHVFYQLCAGAALSGGLPRPETLKLKESSRYKYTNSGIDGGYEASQVIPEVNDAKEFHKVLDCMASLGFTTTEQDAVFRIVAAVLHLGNLEFNQVEREGQDRVEVKDGTQAELICNVLALEKDQLCDVLATQSIQDPLTKKKMITVNTSIKAVLTRHAIAKVLYARLFDWLVWKINQGIGSQERRKDLHHIGLLDIYGFEMFDLNSFEQLCINFANEKLQQHFNLHMFREEQQLYRQEGIAFEHIKWEDNSNIIEALEKKPMGLFCLVDSQCCCNGTDQALLIDIKKQHFDKSSKIIFKPTRFDEPKFAVAHYAGPVTYDVDTFLEKNQDKQHQDITNLLKSSQLELVKQLFTDPIFAPELRTGGQDAKTKAAARRSRSGSDQPEVRGRLNTTVGMMFREQLDRLVEDLNKTDPRFIRCIKANGEKKPIVFDSGTVLRQLRCAGMLEAIRIRRSGYGVRRTFEDFFNKYRLLAPHLTLPPGAKADKSLCKKLLEAVAQKLQRQQYVVEDKSSQIGLTRVFMKDELEKQIERLLADYKKSFTVMIQRTWRGYRQRKHYRAMRKSAILVQAVGRTLLAVHAYRMLKRQHDSAKQMQAALRAYPLRLEFSRRRRAAIHCQRMFRGHWCRSRLGQLRSKKAQEKLRKLREDEARREEQTTSRLRAEQIEAEKLERERENEALRQQLQAATEAKSAQKQIEEEKSAQKQMEEDAQYNQRMEDENRLQQERLRASTAHGDREKALLEKIARLETDNQQLQSRAEMQPSEMERAMNEMQSSQMLQGRPSNKQNEALQSLQGEVMSRLGLPAGLSPKAGNHALSSALVPGKSSFGMLSDTTSTFHTEDDGGRKTLCNQKELFQKLMMKHKEVESTPPGSVPDLNQGKHIEGTEQHEKEVRRLNLEIAKQKTSLLQFEVGKEEFVQDREDMLEQNSRLKADLQDAEQRFSKSQADMKRLTEQKHVAEARCAEFQSQSVNFQAADILRQKYDEQNDSYDELATKEEVASKSLVVAQSEVSRLLKETKAKDIELQDIKNELNRTKGLLDEVMKSHVPREDLQKWKRRAEQIEEQYTNAVRFGAEMNSALGHMTQSASERGGDLSEFQQNYAYFQKENTRKDHELKMAELEKQDLQNTLQNVQSSCEYFQKKHTEMKTLAAGALEKAKEAEGLRAEVAKLQRHLAQAQHEAGTGRHDRQTPQAQVQPTAQAHGATPAAQALHGVAPQNNPPTESQRNSGGRRPSEVGEMPQQRSPMDTTDLGQQRRLAQLRELQSRASPQQPQQQEQEQLHMDGRPSLFTQFQVSRRQGYS